MSLAAKPDGARPIFPSRDEVDLRIQRQAELSARMNSSRQQRAEESTVQLCEPIPKGPSISENLAQYAIGRMGRGKPSCIFELSPQDWQELVEETASMHRDLVRCQISTYDQQRVSVFIAIAGRMREFMCSETVLDGFVRPL